MKIALLKPQTYRNSAEGWKRRRKQYDITSNKSIIYEQQSVASPYQFSLFLRQREEKSDQKLKDDKEIQT